MKINSQELLLINNKKMRLNGVQNQTSPVAEPQETKPNSTLSALDLQGRNNIAFQGSMMNGVKKLALATMMALAVAGGSVMTTGCTEVEQSVTVEIDEALIQRLINAINEGNEKQNEILTQILAEIQAGNQISKETRALLVEVLAGINKLDENDQEGQELMTEILSVINEYIVQEKEMDAATQALLKSIINNQNDFSAQQKQMLEKLIAKLDDIDADLKESFTNLFEKMDTMSDGAKTLGNQILTAILINNNLESAQVSMLATLINQVAELDKNDEAGLKLLNKIWAKAEQYLKENKEADKKELLLLQSILENIQNFNADTKELLLTVIDKIDTLGTNAKELLDKIYKALDKNNVISSENHELLNQVVAGLLVLNENDQKGFELLNKIWAKVESAIAEDKALDEKQIALLHAILDNIQNFNNDNKGLLIKLIEKVDALDKDMVGSFTKLFEKMDTMSDGAKTLGNQILTAILINNNLESAQVSMLATLINQVAELDKNDEAGLKLLNKIWAKAESYMKANQQMDQKELLLLQSILENIQNFNADTKELFAQLMNKVDSMDADVIKALKIIIEKMDNIKGSDSEDVLNEILDAINKNNKISADNNKLLSVVITQLAGLDRNDKKGFELINKIWAQLQESIKYNEALDGKTHALLHAILDNIQGLKDGGKDALNKILNAIDKNSDIAQGTQNLVKELLGKIDKLGDKADKIIETIANIGVGEKVDLTKIEDMLADLLAQEKANGQVFNNLDSKLGLIEVTLEALKKHEMGTDPAVLKKLQAILDKIPAGCTCTHETLDITVIIEKLQDIIDKMDDDKNEGILGDLGNLDNILG